MQQLELFFPSHLPCSEPAPLLACRILPPMLVVDLVPTTNTREECVFSCESQPQSVFPCFPEIMTDGGDDRCLLNSNGVNKYHCSARPVPGALFRASCTCNIPTEEAHSAAEAAYKSLASGAVRKCGSLNLQYL